jgi:hypothetical protein
MDILDRTRKSTFKTAGQVVAGDIIIGANPNDDIRVTDVEPTEPHWQTGKAMTLINGRPYFAHSGLFVK